MTIRRFAPTKPHVFQDCRGEPACSPSAELWFQLFTDVTHYVSKMFKKYYFRTKKSDF